MRKIATGRLRGKDPSPGSSGLAGRPVAVIDLGSNSARIVVARVDPAGRIELLADAHAPLRLVHEMGRENRLKERAIERTVSVLRDFRAIAHRCDVGRVIAVATAAVREATNGPGLLRRIRAEAGFDVRVIDGPTEAWCAFLGAVRGLPVTRGCVIDVGGGSLEISRFRDRRPVASWSLPLGALRMSDRFLQHDPPDRNEARKLQRHVHDRLRRVKIPPLQREGVLIGTGGTIRNLAKIDYRRRSYPIPHLHGYVLTYPRVVDVVSDLKEHRASSRRAIPGLSAGRVDSIVGGGLIVIAVMEAMAAHQLVVSGKGLREGLILAALRLDPPPIAAVRRSSVEALGGRFASWDPVAATRRAAIADRLIHRLSPSMPPAMRELLHHAATLLDTGRSIDFYRRFEHAAQIVMSGDLDCFSHREVALLAAVIECADDHDRGLKRYRPLAKAADREPVLRAAASLALADEIEQRLPLGRESDLDFVVRGRRLIVSSSILGEARPVDLAKRVRAAFGLTLDVRPLEASRV